MIPGLTLIEKIVGFALDIFVRSRARRDELKRNFEKFFRESGKDSGVSAGMHKEHKDLKKNWKKDGDSLH